MKQHGLNRRKKITGAILALAVLLVIVDAIFIFAFFMNSDFKIEFYQISSNKILSNKRLVFISDLHMKEYGKDNDELVKTIEKLSPDLIIVGGDLVIYGNKDYQSMLELCTRLSEIAPLYGVMGNHESQMVHSGGDTELVKAFEKSGLVLLRNKETTIEVGGDRISLVGISGTTSNFEKDGAKKAMDNLKETSDLRICIAHIPYLFKDKLSQYDFDLALSGHTHGAIVILPVVGGLYTDEEGLLPEFDYGTKSLDNDATLIISRGLGDSSKPSWRINNSHELSVIDIVWH